MNIINCCTVVLFSIVSANLYAVNCSQLKDSGDGVPNSYRQAECKGKLALEGKRYTLAVTQFKIALGISLYEAPNYDLKLELAKSLCSLGKNRDGLAVLASFQCMSKADLGKIKCPAKYDTSNVSDCNHLACEGSASSLTKKAKKFVQQRLKLAKTIALLCR